MTTDCTKKVQEGLLIVAADTGGALRQAWDGLSCVVGTFPDDQCKERESREGMLHQLRDTVETNRYWANKVRLLVELLVGEFN